MALELARPCADLSEALGEPLAGTAPEHTERTLLVPHRGPMAKEPLDSPQLALPREWIEAALRAVPRSRMHLFVREPGHPLADALLVAHTSPEARVIRRFSLAEATSAEALAELLRSPSAGEAVEGPLHLVCTHGKRDACCARRGTALHRALQAHAGDRVLRTSHLGGHRFAPIVHSFPAGLCFGRVEIDEVARLDEAAARGEAYDPSRLRGVFPHDGFESAALVRYLAEGGTLAGASVSREGELVRITSPSLTRVYRVKRESLEPRPLSCGAAPGEAFRFDVQEAEER